MTDKGLDLRLLFAMYPGKCLKKLEHSALINKHQKQEVLESNPIVAVVIMFSNICVKSDPHMRIKKKSRRTICQCSTLTISLAGIVSFHMHVGLLIGCQAVREIYTPLLALFPLLIVTFTAH